MWKQASISIVKPWAPVAPWDGLNRLWCPQIVQAQNFTPSHGHIPPAGAERERPLPHQYQRRVFILNAPGGSSSFSRSRGWESMKWALPAGSKVQRINIGQSINVSLSSHIKNLHPVCCMSKTIPSWLRKSLPKKLENWRYEPMEFLKTNVPHTWVKAFEV